MRAISPFRRMERPRRSTPARIGSPETLEVRLALSTTASSVMLESATTVDSRSVTIRYEADPTAQIGRTLQFAVYRSADDVFDPSDLLVDVYDAPASARTPGVHELTIPLAGGLPIDVARPYVLIVAEPGVPGAETDPARTAAFRKFSLGVVTHGGIINRSWTYGAPWQLQIGRLMEDAGYDAVIPYNWILESHQPGHAAPQGFKLVNQIQRILDQLPDDAVVDLHMIGHSQGAVVNSVALQTLDEDAPRAVNAGWIQNTLLDPHAANNYVPGQMDTSATVLGGIARMVVESYQGRAKDPTVAIPTNVDETDVFYQHTYVRDIHLMNPSGYNLWGQVPIPNHSDGPIHYYNLTQAGATHSGASGVALWYRNFIAPTFASQTPLLRELELNGGLVNASPTTWTPPSELERRVVENWGADQVVHANAPRFEGTAAPGANVRVYVGPTSDLTQLRLLEVVEADETGAWTIDAGDQPFVDGRYRAVAMAYSPEHHTRPAFAIVSMRPMGRFWIGGDRRDWTTWA